VLALIGQAQPDAPQSPPAGAPPRAAVPNPPGTAQDVGADFTVVVELGERQLNVQESWTLQAPSDKTVPASQIHIPMPKGAKGLRLDERSQGFHAEETSAAIDATEPLTASRALTGGFLYDFSGNSASISFPIPFAVHQARIVVQDIPGLEISTNVETQRRKHDDVNGRSYLIYDTPAMPRGGALEVTIGNLPMQTLWPRRIMLAFVVGILGWMMWALKTRAVPGADGAAQSFGPLSAHARKEQIVKALEVLERDLNEERVKEKRYQRRHGELMKELATVLREIELEAAGAPRRDVEGHEAT
jgi:hypothetical protein